MPSPSDCGLPSNININIPIIEDSANRQNAESRSRHPKCQTMKQPSQSPMSLQDQRPSIAVRKRLPWLDGPRTPPSKLPTSEVMADNHPSEVVSSVHNFIQFPTDISWEASQSGLRSLTSTSSTPSPKHRPELSKPSAMPSSMNPVLGAAEQVENSHVAGTHGAKQAEPLLSRTQSLHDVESDLCMHENRIEPLRYPRTKTSFRALGVTEKPVRMKSKNRVHEHLAISKDLVDPADKHHSPIRVSRHNSLDPPAIHDHTSEPLPTGFVTSNRSGPPLSAVEPSVDLAAAIKGLEDLMEEAMNVAREAARVGQVEEAAPALSGTSLALQQASHYKAAVSAVRPDHEHIPVISECDNGPGFGIRSTTSKPHAVLRLVPHTRRPPPSEHAWLNGEAPKPQNAAVDQVVQDTVIRPADRLLLSQTFPQAHIQESPLPDISRFTINGRARRRLTRSLPVTDGPGSAKVVRYSRDCEVALSPRALPKISAPMDPRIRVRTANPHIPTQHASSSARLRTRPESLDNMQRRLRRRLPAVAHQDTDAIQWRVNILNDPGVDIRDDPDLMFVREAAAENLQTEQESFPSDAQIIKSVNLRHPRRHHISLDEGKGFSLGRYHRRRPIAREWNTFRKRLTATVACLNTIFIGLIAGIYAGEVPRMQYQLADQTHWVIWGNVLLFSGLGLTTLIFWPLPLLHGRKPYVLLAFSLMLPLQVPPAVAVSAPRAPAMTYKVAMLLPRALTGVALGFANINFLPMMFDLFGASLMSVRPHQEVVVYDDVRRQGGGLGLWLGIWTFCFTSALSIGFCVGACIVAALNPAWGFYVVAILLAVFLLINVVTPETRRAPYRRSIIQFLADDDLEVKRRVARGEVKLHISNEGPKWWFEELWAGLVLTKRMVFQPGFLILMSYLGWIIAELTFVILFLGALLSRSYRWKPQWVGLAALAIPIGAALALPLAKASWFSRDRTEPTQTDSATWEHRITMSSHLIRRVTFSLLLPFASLAFCLSASGPPMTWALPVLFAGCVGFLTDLGLAECVGLIMETFDTCDLQPGTNSKHRLQSMPDLTRHRRTNYSSFPRVCAGFFAAQSFGFILSAASTAVSGWITNDYGTQTAIGVVAAILLIVTVLLIIALWRWKRVTVIPSYTAPGKRASRASALVTPNDPDWMPVVVGNPSSKVRRMNMLEMGAWTRWSEIRKLNLLVRP